jgi:MFS family permease
MTNRLRVLLAPLRAANFRLLWLSMFISLIGDGIYTIAIAWKTYDLANDPSALALIGVVYTGPQVIFSLVGGVASDRGNRKKLLIISDLARFLIISSIGIAAALDVLTLTSLSILVVLYGIADSFYRPAFGAMIPMVVQDELLMQANSLNQIAEPIALRFLGPALGGVLVAAGGASFAFLADGVTFVASAILVSLLSIPSSVKTRAARGLRAAATALMVDSKEALGFIRHHAWLWGSMLAATLSLLLVFGPFWVLVPFLIRNNMSTGAEGFGAVMAVGGIGAIVAAVFASGNLPKRHVTTMYVSWAIALGSLVIFGLAQTLWQMMIASLILHAFLAIGTIVWLTVQQRVVAGSMLGRVSGLDWVATVSLIPLSYSLTAPLSEALGAETTLVLAGVGGGIIMLAFLLVPGISALQDRELDYLPLPGQSSEAAVP